MLNMGTILGLVMVLAKDIQEKAKDDKITVKELLDILGDTTETLGLSDVVIIDMSKIL